MPALQLCLLHNMVQSQVDGLLSLAHGQPSHSVTVRTDFLYYGASIQTALGNLAKLVESGITDLLSHGFVITEVTPAVGISSRPCRSGAYLRGGYYFRGLLTLLAHIIWSTGHLHSELGCTVAMHTLSDMQ
jgi:hypothetical protein